MATHYLMDGSTDLTFIRNFTGATLTATISDDQINFYIDLAEAEVFRKTGLHYYDTTITETYDGDGTDTLVLRYWPVRSVTSLSIDDEVVSGSCYWIYPERNMIRLKEGYFDDVEPEVRNNQNISITYVYGAPAVADQFKFQLARKIVFNSVCKDILMQVGSQDSGGILSEKLEQYSLSYGKGPYAMVIDQLDRENKEIYNSLGVHIGIIVI